MRSIVGLAGLYVYGYAEAINVPTNDSVQDVNDQHGTSVIYVLQGNGLAPVVFLRVLRICCTPIFKFETFLIRITKLIKRISPVYKKSKKLYSLVMITMGSKVLSDALS